MYIVSVRTQKTKALQQARGFYLSPLKFGSRVSVLAPGREAEKG
jgi:hypothetical protein